MVIKFPKIQETLPPAEAFALYRQLTEHHLYFLEKQSKCEFFYWKTLGAFFLLILGFFFLQGKPLAILPFAETVFSGFVALFVILQNMKADLEYGKKALACVEKGLLIEEKQDLSGKLFGVFENTKQITYRANVLSRLFPTGLVVLITTTAAIFLALKVAIWLAVAIAGFSSVSFYALARGYIKRARKILLGA